MKKIKLFFSFILIILIIFFIFIYILLKNLNEGKIITELENKYDLKIKQEGEGKIKIFPNIEYNTSLEITDFQKRFTIDQINISISQPLFNFQGKLDISLGEIFIKNLKFSNIEIKGNINYINNYIKNRNKLKNLFDGIYKINGNFALQTTNEEKFIISFLKLFFENLEDK